MKILKLSINLLKNFEMIKFEKEKSKYFYFIMALITFLIIFIPISILTGYITYTLTNITNSDLGLRFVFYLLSIFSFIFSINVIINVFYTAKDIEYLKSLPLSDENILISKFITCVINESFMEGIIVLSSSIGYLIAIKASFISYLPIILNMILFSIIPLAIAGIISILFMYLVKNVKNRNLINKISSLITILAITLLVVIVVILYSKVDLDNISLENNKFLEIMNYIFINISFLVKGYNNIISYLIFLFINFIFLFILYIFAKLMYKKGLVITNSTNTNKKELVFKQKNNHLSYFIKELKLLFKTPAYFSNCIIINFIWPIFIFILLFLYNKIGNFNDILNNYYNKDNFTLIMFFVMIIVCSILITAANSISSSSFSREGQSVYFEKSLPISEKHVILLKNLPGIVISYLGLFIYILFFGIIFRLGVLNIIYYLIISFISVATISNLGLFLDTKNPKLVWDDEMNALRGNHGVFINMAISIVCSLLLIGLMILLNFLNVKYYFIYLINLFVMILFLIISSLLLIKTGVKNYLNLE